MGSIGQLLADLADLAVRRERRRAGGWGVGRKAADRLLVVGSDH